MLSWDYLRKFTATLFDSEFLEVMQYTGLKDKNGKEIYEGDLGYPSRANKQRLFQVKWFPHGTYGWVWVAPSLTRAGNTVFGGVDDISNAFSSDQWGCEVIGNIYENPELLQE
jgi:hypothetical protein